MLKSKNKQRLCVVVAGAVQGVGFRPFVYRLAGELSLTGLVRNSLRGVEIEIEGETGPIGIFLDRLKSQAPPNSVIRSIKKTLLPLADDPGFEIQLSNIQPDSSPGEVLPDLATCDECLDEIFDPANRRHLYPFTNCTHCGPRYSIIRGLPYDRKNTTMRGFSMCTECLAEYRDPQNRRFHAQPNACPECGPKVSFGEEQGGTAIESAASAIRAGQIVAIKGIGGFHLFADARDENVVDRLRSRKHRPDKPLSIMFPELGVVLEHCEASDSEVKLLQSVAAPIVLLRQKESSGLACNLAPGNPRLGALLPYSPLHHVLMRQLGFPVVATSGNLSDEPICIDNREAQHRLRGIADAFLLHDRPIQRAVDDSVGAVVAGREFLVRRSRGMAPAPIEMADTLPRVLALGGDLKNTIAVSSGNRVFLSQHHGDLDTAGSLDAFTRHIRDLPELCGTKPVELVCDLHPGYHSSRFAAESNYPIIEVQHHHAHIASCLAENGVDEEVLGVAWDGTGYGPDRSIWGGEFLIATQGEFRRYASLRPFPLPGGEKAVREPRSAAFGLLFEAGIPIAETSLAEAFHDREREATLAMLEKNINSPYTSSAGRLFDAVAALSGLRHRSTFEGQAATELESCLPADAESIPAYPCGVNPGDWSPILTALLEDLARETPTGIISAKFHNAMVEMILKTAHQAERKKVALSGGCFQNRYLLEQTIRHLRNSGFTPIWHRLVPSNDGGLALGQVVVAARTSTPSNSSCA